MKIVVVIPTYNEAENIRLLIPALNQEFRQFPQHDIHILVVDGNSPDGTASVVNDLSLLYPNVHLLLEKQKAGLGAAYFYGFTHAMHVMQADAVVEMDADFQHDPKDLSKLILEFDKGYDYVIGSRYVKGGSIPKEWAFYRKFLSVGGNVFTKFVLGIFDVNDFTTGFKISRVRGFLDQIDFSKINSKGFAYKMELLYKMHLLGAKIKEVPITFGVRDRGDSKMEKANTLDSLKVVCQLRYQQSKSFFKFLVVGLAGLFTDSIIFTIARLLTRPYYASAISGFIGMLTTFTLNNFWSFKEQRLTKVHQLIGMFIPYSISSYIPIIFRSWLIHFAVYKIADNIFVEYGAFFTGIFVGLVWNYIIYSRVIWRKNKNIIKW